MTIKELQGTDLSHLEGTHKFLSEETLVPNLNKSDTTRINMFTSHLIQAQILNKGQTPKVFTNFEEQVGQFSSGYKKAEKNYTVLKKIIKNKFNYILIVKDKNGNLDVIERNPAKRTTESFGYKMVNDGIDNLSEGDAIEKDKWLYHNTSYDKHHNFTYGRNLNVLFLTYKDMTHEDGIIIKKSTAEKLSTLSTPEIKVEVNTNDVLVNIYGSMSEYKSFPDIGEPVKDGIIASRRRINYQSAFYDLSTSNLNRTNFATDNSYYTESDSIVYDIDIYSNVDIETLEEFDYNSQIVKYLKMNLEYCKEIVEFLEPYYKKVKFSDDLSFLYKRSKDTLDPNVKWKDENSDFDNVVINFKIMKNQPIVVGSKITNRYGFYK